MWSSLIRQPLFRDAVARVIRQDADLQLAAELADGRAALAAIRRDVPTVAVIARDLAELDGERVLAAVARERLDTRVLVLIDGPPDTSTWSLLGNGAAGVLSRGVTAEALRSAVHRVATGGTALCEDAQAAVADGIRIRHPREGPLLSPREQEVLDLLADGLSTPAHRAATSAWRDDREDARRQPARQGRASGAEPSSSEKPCVASCSISLRELEVLALVCRSSDADDARPWIRRLSSRAISAGCERPPVLRRTGSVAP